MSIDKVSEDVISACPPLMRSSSHTGADNSTSNISREPLHVGGGMQHADPIQYHSVNALGTINVRNIQLQTAEETFCDFK